MKKTTRGEWRVMVTLKVRRPADLGLTGIDDLAEFIAPPGPLTIAVLPRRLGSFTFGSVGDGLVSDDIDRDYRLRCEDIADELRSRPQVEDVSVCCTETHSCSHCGLTWEELTADEAADASTNQDEHSVAGEPVCCEDAIDEFRAERGIPALRRAGSSPARPAGITAAELASLPAGSFLCTCGHWDNVHGVFCMADTCECARFEYRQPSEGLAARSRGASEIKHPAMGPTREHLAENPMPEQRKDGVA